MEEEIIGVKLLEKVATNMYGDNGDPSKVYSKDKPFMIDTDIEGNVTLTINLPFGKKEETKIRKKGEELIIEIGDYKRILLLPKIAQNMKIGSARFEEKKLIISFIKTTKSVD